MARGKAQRGEKTMVDAPGPGIDVLKQAQTAAEIYRGPRRSVAAVVRDAGQPPYAGDQRPGRIPGPALHRPPGSRCHIRLLYAPGAVRDNREHSIIKNSGDLEAY